MRAIIRVALFALALLPLCCLPSLRGAERGKLAVYFINVGQGDGIYVKFPNGDDMLVDAGVADEGKTVVNFLKEHKVDDLEYLVATHNDFDHIGGMQAVMKAYKVERCWQSEVTAASATYKKLQAELAAKKIKTGVPKAGAEAKAGEVTIRVLAPGKTPAKPGKNETATNSDSIVMSLTYGKTVFLLTGDMTLSERKTVADWPDCDVLKVPHHGSKYSYVEKGNDPFITATKPEYAVISVGKNDYGHPTQRALTLLKDAKAQILRTDEAGTIEFTSDGVKVERVK